MEDESFEEGSRGVLVKAKDTVLLPFRTATSKPARRAYLSTILFLLTALVLAALAVTAYTLFYYAYIPVLGFERPVHLQFDDPFPVTVGGSSDPGLDGGHVHPCGLGILKDKDGSAMLVGGQGYDIKVVLTLPRTPRNIDAGNFMLDLRLLSDIHGSRDSDVAAGVTAVLHNVRDESDTNVLARSRRPATLTWYSPFVEHVNIAVELPYYLTGWRKEAETLHVVMMEGIEFPKRGNVPGAFSLALQSFTSNTIEPGSSVGRLQVYGVKVMFRARFKGLRWLMYNHRVTSFIIFTTLFWSVEMTTTMTAWLALSFFIFGAKEEVPRIKQASEDERVKGEPMEEEDLDNLSDTSRTFPTSSRQPPLRYSSPKLKKEEDFGEEAMGAELTQVPSFPHVEADDEDEDADFVLDGRPAGRSDSGIGTSLESSAGRAEGIKRRRSRGLGGDGRGY